MLKSAFPLKIDVASAVMDPTKLLELVDAGWSSPMAYKPEKDVALNPTMPANAWGWKSPTRMWPGFGVLACVPSRMNPALLPIMATEKNRVVPKLMDPMPLAETANVPPVIWL